MPEDKEILAMSNINTALAELDERTTSRVLRWALDRFSAKTQPGNLPDFAKKLDPLNPAGAEQLNAKKEPASFKDLPELFAAMRPATESDKLLAAGYWFQELQGQEALDSYEINKELKHLGHGLPNITRAFSVLMSRMPALAIQLRKSGTAKQARKKYRLTTEGIQEVKRLLAGNGTPKQAEVPVEASAAN